MDIFLSAIIYLFTILWAYFFSILAQKKFSTGYQRLDNKRLKKTGVFYLIIAISVPCILAGIRGDSVGTDVLGYATKIMDEANKVNTFQELNVIDRTYTEYGYRLLAFLISRLFSNLGWLLFFTELITIGSVAVALYLFRDDLPISVGMLFFMTCQYHYSFNAMRQMMAAALLLISFYFLINSKFVKYLIISIIAGSIHTFSLVVSVILFILWTLRKWYNTKQKKYFVIFAVIFAVFAWESIMKIALQYLFTGSLYRYARYFTSDYDKVSAIDVLTSPTIWINVLIFIICSLSIQREKDSFKDNYDSALYVILLLSVFCKFMQIYLAPMNRMGVYLAAFNCIFIPRSLSVKYNRISKKDRKFLLVVLMLGYWLIDCMLSGYTSTNILTFRL